MNLKKLLILLTVISCTGVIDARAAGRQPVTTLNEFTAEEGSPFRDVADQGGSSSLEENIFYVGCENCSDTDPGYGLDPSAPFCTFERALDEVIDCEGAVIRALGGTYNEQLRINKSGSPDRPLLIEPCSGSLPVLDGTGLVGVWEGTSWHGLAGMYDVSNVIFRGFVLQNCRDYHYREPIQSGITIGYGFQATTCTNIEIADLRIRDTDHGGIVFDGGCSRFIASGNEVTGTNRLEEDRIAGSVHEAVTVSGCSSFLLERNNIHDVYEEGIDIKDGSSNGVVRHNLVSLTGATGIYLNNAVYIDVYGNRIFHPGGYRDPASDSGDGISLSIGDGATGPDTTSLNRIFRNTIMEASRQGVSFYSRGLTDGEIGGNLIFNNTIHRSGWARNGGYSIYLGAVEISRDNLIFNNIFSSSDAWKTEIRGSTEGVEGHHNLFYNTYGLPEIYIENIDPWYPSDSVFGDPLFTDPLSGDFSIEAGSPAIDLGVCIEGGLFFGEGIDAGVFEFNDGGWRSNCPPAPIAAGR